MSVNLGDSDLRTRPPVAPPIEKIPVAERLHLPWWWAPIAILLIIMGISLGVWLAGGDETEPASGALGLAESEYAVDSSLVVYEPGFETASFFIGTDAGLDPDNPAWFQIEFARDTSLVVYEPGFETASFFIGTDAGLDPDNPAWFQIEFARDTSLVLYEPGFETASFWVGTSGEIEVEK